MWSLIKCHFKNNCDNFTSKLILSEKTINIKFLFFFIGHLKVTPTKSLESTDVYQSETISGIIVLLVNVEGMPIYEMTQKWPVRPGFYYT